MTAHDPVTGETAKPDVSDVSVGHLVGEIGADLSTLMRQELALARAEITQELTKTGKAAGLLGGAGFAGYMLLLFVSFAAWWGLANVMDQSWAALIVAAVWAVVGAVLFAVGRGRLREVHPAPERTAETLRELPATIKSR
jgi:Na+/melibiose symporter-like transporter